jgi:hypothetical protein
VYPLLAPHAVSYLPRLLTRGRASNETARLSDFARAMTCRLRIEKGGGPCPRAGWPSGPPFFALGGGTIGAWALFRLVARLILPPSPSARILPCAPPGAGHFCSRSASSAARPRTAVRGLGGPPKPARRRESR